MSRIWTIARRELKALFDHPTGYILLVVFVVINNFLFFRQAYLTGAASLRPMMDLLPWLLLFLVPAVTMRTLADDTRSGTIEIVLAQPLTELELLLGKFLGALLFLWITLAATLVIPVGFSFGADLHAGVVIAQYVGAGLLAAGLCGVGLWASSLTRNQITAFIIGVAVMFVLILVGLNPLLVGLPPTLSAIAARLGVLTHFTDIGRGVIDLRDVLYFVSLAAVFLALAYGALMARKLAAGRDARHRLRLGTGLLVAVAVVANLLGGSLGGRLDLTPGNAYTLSPATKDILRGLDDLVTINLFASSELPPEVSLLKRDLDDLLRDLRSAGDGNVRIIERDPAEDEEAAEDAQRMGVPSIQFNVFGQAQLQIKEGYLGLAVQYADETETIPVVRQTEDLEYQLVSAIRGMTRTEQPAVGLIATPRADVMGQATYNQVQQALRDQYRVRTVSLADSGVAGDVRVLIVAGSPDSLPAVERDRLVAFLNRGGGLLLMASGTQPQAQQGMLLAVPSPVPWNDALGEYGVSIRPDIAYDLRSHESVMLPGAGGFRVMTPYPFWLRAGSTGEAPAVRDLQTVFLPWTSTVDTSGAVSGTVTPLFITTEAAGAYDIHTVLDPQRQFRTDSLSRQVTAVQVNPLALEGAADSVTRGRVILVGNHQFAADRHVQNARENLVFVLNAVDWLAQDDALIQIRSKDRRPPQLTMEDTGRTVVKYANMVGVPVLIALAGLLRLIRRRRTTRRRYTREEAA